MILSKNQEHAQQSRHCSLDSLEKDKQLAVYVHSVRSKTQRHVLTKYRLSDHKLLKEEDIKKHMATQRGDLACDQSMKNALIHLDDCPLIIQ